MTQARVLVPVRWLLAMTVFLIGFRIALNVLDSNVIDVGYSGVIGADRLADGATLWGTFPPDNDHGDTYGPVAYAAYLPFEQILPWSGRLGRPPCGRTPRAIVWDLLCLSLLFRIGRTPGRRRPGCRAGLRLGRLPVHAVRAEHERQRRARRRARPRGARCRDLTGGERGARRARRPGRSSRRSRSRRCWPPRGRTAGPAMPRASRAGLALVRVLAGALALASGGAGDVPRPHARLPGSGATRRSRSGGSGTASGWSRWPCRSGRCCSPWRSPSSRGGATRRLGRAGRRGPDRHAARRLRTGSTSTWPGSWALRSWRCSGATAGAPGRWPPPASAPSSGRPPP